MLISRRELWGEVSVELNLPLLSWNIMFIRKDNQQAIVIQNCAFDTNHLENEQSDPVTLRETNDTIVAKDVI